MTGLASRQIPRFGWRRQWLAPHLRRRLLAAALAGAAVLLALTSVHRKAAVLSAPVARSPASIADRVPAGLVAAPVRLVDPGVAPLLHPGQLVDVLAAASSPLGGAEATQTAAVAVAAAARVLSVPASSPQSSESGTLVVLEVTPDEARALAGSEASGRLSVVFVAR